MTEERELGWNDEIEKENEFILLPEGDYDFTVTKFERARHSGSANLPPCHQAKLELTIHSAEHGDVIVFHNLFLHTKTEGLLSNFFAGIGQKKKGEKARMDWNKVVGSKGRCKIKQNKYTTSKGEERVNNQVQKFYYYEDVYGTTPQTSAAINQSQQFTQPFPTQQNNFTPGQF